MSILDFNTQKLIIELLNQELCKADRLVTRLYYGEIKQAKINFIQHTYTLGPISTRGASDMSDDKMVWTAIYRQRNGDIAADISYSSHDKEVAWKELQKKFNGRLLALIPGNHKAVIEKEIS